MRMKATLNIVVFVYFVCMVCSSETCCVLMLFLTCFRVLYEGDIICCYFSYFLVVLFMKATLYFLLSPTLVQRWWCAWMLHCVVLLLSYELLSCDVWRLQYVVLLLHTLMLCAGGIIYCFCLLLRCRVVCKGINIYCCFYILCMKASLCNVFLILYRVA